MGMSEYCSLSNTLHNLPLKDNFFIISIKICNFGHHNSIKEANC